jgi:hypothetical protein
LVLCFFSINLILKKHLFFISLDQIPEWDQQGTLDLVHQVAALFPHVPKTKKRDWKSIAGALGNKHTPEVSLIFFIYYRFQI